MRLLINREVAKPESRSNYYEIPRVNEDGCDAIRNKQVFTVTGANEV